MMTETRNGAAASDTATGNSITTWTARVLGSSTATYCVSTYRETKPSRPAVKYLFTSRVRCAYAVWFIWPVDSNNVHRSPGLSPAICPSILHEYIIRCASNSAALIPNSDRRQVLAIFFLLSCIFDSSFFLLQFSQFICIMQYSYSMSIAWCIWTVIHICNAHKICVKLDYHYLYRSLLFTARSYSRRSI